MVEEVSGSASRRKRAGDDTDRQPDEGGNLQLLTDALNINLAKNLQPGETPVRIQFERRPPRT